MRNCAIIVNTLSGNSVKVDMLKLKSVFAANRDVDIIQIEEQTVLGSLENYDRIVICGGDGTVNSVLNCPRRFDAQLFYCPFGTMNEFGTEKGDNDVFQIDNVNRIGERYFTYVFAAGIFTPLGYIVKTENKKTFKALAYIFKVVGQYKIHSIDAAIETNGFSESGRYTLIMAIDSPRCFGFKFNKCYRRNDGGFHLLTVKTPKHKGLLGKIEVFFPLFRAFFIGFSKEYSSKNMRFFATNKLSLSLKDKTDFCMDGEKYQADGVVKLETKTLNAPITVVSKKTVNRLYARKQTL
jgi:diacylglycerol kinase family enzyme